MRAVIYDCLARVDPVFAREMHADTWPKPLAISPLWWRGNGWELDIAVLLDGMGQMLLQGLAEHGPDMRLGHEIYHRQDIRLGDSATIDEFQHLSGSVTQLLLDFLTPTTHHDTLMLDPILNRKTKSSYPLPDPARTVTSWFHKWNCLMGRTGSPPIPDTFLDQLPYLVLARMHGETQDIRLGDWQRLIGFTGSAVFEVLAPDRMPAHFTSTLRLLSAFANYCGTGVETLRGMGQTRVWIRP